MMKRSWVLLIVIGILLQPVGLLAAELVYSPANASIVVPAGTERGVPVTVGLENIEAYSSYYAWIVDAVNGTLPKAWITAAPATSFFSPTSPSASFMLSVAVPAGTPAGPYSGYVLSKAKSAHRFAARGNGVFIQVTVPAQCTSVPTFTDMTVSPDTIWPPNHTMDDVTVTGRIDLPEGCGVLNAGYSIDDEYGVYTATGHITLGRDMDVNFTLPVEATRDGQDRDGRHYRITVFAEDEAGIGMSETLTVVVPHDRREKSE